MRGYHFTKYDFNSDGRSRFEQLLDTFMQLLTYTSGDVGEALQWLNELDKNFELTDEEYGMGDFIEDLRDKGYITEDNQRGEVLADGQPYLFGEFFIPTLVCGFEV